jgi:hypothetical protein
MKQELDEQLCKKYPKIFKNRHASMQETCMCWGFECGDGWYNIIDQLCANIQHHINWIRKCRAGALVYNRVLKRALNGDTAGLEWYHTYEGALPRIVNKRVDDSIYDAEYRTVVEKCHQVVVEQVKEKFGSLSFYYTGGDNTIDGMVRMAESMSEVSCEECGAPGKRNHSGWLRVRCAAHNNYHEDTEEIS